ncbi:PIG-L deacetylase family protein [Sphingomonas sp.]|uniref:PIG-L deacetylase family protein n=1 Tax=Sphingomonas sp. TaxID=28214 RepID=UPI003AFFABA9
MVGGSDGEWRALARRARRVDAGALARAGTWLALAPHPDDETLGPGGLIAALAAAGTPPVVAYLTDGSGSHVGAPGWSPARVAAARSGEARAALRRLGVTAPPLWLGWTDAAPQAPGDTAFLRARDRLLALCRRRRVRAIVTTWRGDPHCDHEAASLLAAAVARHRRLAVYETPVWGWRSAMPPARVLALDIRRHRPALRRALDAHATQRGGRIAGGTSFRLPPAMRRMVDRPLTLLLEAAHAP